MFYIHDDPKCNMSMLYYKKNGMHAWAVDENWVTQGVYITEDGSNHLPVNATIDQGITQRDNSFVN